MKIENLEYKLLKSSKIEDGDNILVKINDFDKNSLSKEDIKNLYEKISSMVKKEVGIYFFPANLEISLIKDLIKNNSLNNMIKEEEYKEAYENNNINNNDISDE